MKKTLYLIVGASGSGKDYIVDKMCRDFGTSRVISRTTRPKRNENDLHIFVDRDTCASEWPKAIAKTYYNKQHYYVLPEDLDDKDFYIIDPVGVDSLMEAKTNGCPALDRRISVVYIKSPWYVVALNMFKRGDSIKSIFRRLEVDAEAFKDVDCDLKFRNSDGVYNFFKRAKDLHVL